MSTSVGESAAVDRAIGGRVAWLMKFTGGRQRTQAELGDHLGLDQSAVSKKLRGERPFTIRELYAVAEWLGRPVSDIVADRDQLGDPPPLVPRTRRASTSVVISEETRGLISARARARYAFSGNVAQPAESLAA